MLPSLSENFALTVAESLMRGVPVVATKGTPWAGLETHMCGQWVSGDIDSLGAAMSGMMGMTAGERRMMGLRGRRWMLTDFAWEGVARDYLAVYRWLAGNGPKPTVVHF